MATSLYIAAIAPGSGKSVVALGLMELLPAAFAEWVIFVRWCSR